MNLFKWKMKTFRWAIIGLALGVFCLWSLSASRSYATDAATRMQAGELALAAVQTVQGFMNDSQAGMENIQRQMDDLSLKVDEINKGIGGLIQNLEDLRLSLSKEFEKNRQIEYHARVMGAWTQYLEVKSAYFNKEHSVDENRLQGYRQELQSILSQLRAVRSELFHVPTVAASSLTLCMAQACEIALAQELKEPTDRTHSFLGLYREWFQRALDKTKERSLTWELSRTSAWRNLRLHPPWNFKFLTKEMLDFKPGKYLLFSASYTDLADGSMDRKVRHQALLDTVKTYKEALRSKKEDPSHIFDEVFFGVITGPPFKTIDPMLWETWKEKLLLPSTLLSDA